MTCEHCQGVMVEEQLVVTGGLVRVKGLSAWYCMQCGRVDYQTVQTVQTVAANPHISRPGTKHTAQKRLPKAA
jgi:uncharacterized Zn finger protein